MPLKSLLKLGRPDTPKMGSVPLPGDDDLPPHRRARTTSILKGRLMSPTSRPATPVRAHTPFAPASIPFRAPTPVAPSPSLESDVASSPTLIAPSPSLSSQTTVEEHRFFRIEPDESVAARCATPRPAPPQRWATPKPSPPSRVASPAPQRIHSSPEQILKPRRTSSSSTHSPLSPQAKADNALVPYKPPPPPAQLHWQLLPYEATRGKPYLHFDVAHSPNFIRIHSKTIRAMRADDRQKSAASTPLTEMTICCMSLPRWKVRVKRPDGGPITCFDVFHAIYDTFHRPLTDAERQSIPKEFIEGCEAQFKSRCKATACLTDVEERAGMRRVDLLRGRTVFKGLTYPNPGTSVWMLHLEKAK